MKTTELFRLIFLLIAVSINAMTLNAQSAYLDAVKLKNDAKNNNGKFSNKTDSILNRYDISRYNCSNSFLNPYIEPYKVGAIAGATENNKSEKIADSEKGVVNFFSSLGGLNVTTTADGFAKFIVKRTKQELSIAFFDRFKQELDSLEQLQIIFPQTYMVLSAIGNDIYMYEVYIQTLKASFQRDLATLPSNLPQLVYNYRTYFKDHPEFEAMLLSAFYFAQSIQTNQHPGMIIENYPLHYLDSIDENVKASFQIAQLISKSLRSDNDSIYWITTKEANKLLSDSTLLKIYLGLVMQQSKIDNVVFAGGVSLYDEMNKTKYNDYSQYIYTFIAKSQQVESLIKSINKQQKDSLVYEKYYTTASSIIDLMHFTAKGVDVWMPKNGNKLNWDQTTKPYFDLSQTSINLAIDINRKDYSSAIVNTASILKSVFKDPKDSLVAQQIIKYGTFMALVAQAKNSEEVEAAIEAIALPTGSARIKRESKLNVSLNAYCGLFVGQNRTRFWSAPEYSAGISAPIGFAASWGVKHSSLSAFISIIDIGAIAAYRFSNSTDSIPTIKLADILAPGVFFSWGIPKCPISINAGCQMAPLLSAVNTKANTFGSKSLRFTLGIYVDLPVLNLYNSTKSKKHKK